MTRDGFLAAIRGGLIVSCQADPGDPLEDTAMMAAMARAAAAGGAVAIRAEGAANIRAIKAAVALPVIGLRKRHYPESPVYITPTLEDALEVVAAGADVVALDATSRSRPGGQALSSLVEELKRRGVLVMADVSSLEEGLAAAALGCDLVGTTLSGYTGAAPPPDLPDLELVAALRARFGADVPVIAEGRIWTPEQAVEALNCGASAVVVGTAITRPAALTRRIAQALSRHQARLRATAVGIDLGGTRTLVGIGDLAGDFRHEQAFSTPWRLGMAAVVGKLTQAVQQVIQAAGATPCAVGVAATGRVDVEKGMVVGGVPLAHDYLAYPLRKELSRALRLPVHVENDVNAAAYAEYQLLPLPRPSRFAVVTIGTGVGGGILIDGQLVRGINAGEIGHLCVRQGGRKCRCGARGCLEAYVSRRLLAQQALSTARQGLVPLATDREPTAEELAALLRVGEPHLSSLFNRQLDYLACALASLRNIVDPDIVVLGGELSALGEHLLEGLRVRVGPRPPLRCAHLGNRAGAVGGAQLALLRFA
ncbi:MAG: putative N-acetylmannosamine-6-phosphate 2-epimerase [bacterium]|jgi:N-acetylmannosamine-6-phosphate 2-epimerase/N-acetylmannosamine kinase|nr:putative N-acetylmannosamine-6-phosphate 2-epimerase [candidate division KSB1 bacterium]MDH7559297.1 putative N-acetylmannosamine-6-phosphate 2-epimerase [bacterium]